MVNDTLLSHLESVIGTSISSVSPLSGGDISEAYLVKSNTNYFLKCNTSENAHLMFEAEKLGLERIAQSKTIKTPTVFACDKLNTLSFLLIEYIPVKRPTQNEMNRFGHQLAALHQYSYEEFGFDSPNFIGSLAQSNNWNEDWATFYIEQRLKPQLQLAGSNHLLKRTEMPDDVQLFNRCQPLFRNVRPSLLHGDLWGGNYIFSESGEPFLIDPSVYFGHHEVDIAMSLLFGNFGQSFYEGYHQVIPKTEGFTERISLYQLYYLLVHLNIFGSSYYAAVKRILTTYF